MVARESRDRLGIAFAALAATLVAAVLASAPGAGAAALSGRGGEAPPAQRGRRPPPRLLSGPGPDRARPPLLAGGHSEGAAGAVHGPRAPPPPGAPGQLGPGPVPEPGVPLVPRRPEMDEPADRRRRARQEEGRHPGAQPRPRLDPQQPAPPSAQRQVLVQQGHRRPGPDDRLHRPRVQVRGRPEQEAGGQVRRLDRPARPRAGQPGRLHRDQPRAVHGLRAIRDGARVPVPEAPKRLGTARPAALQAHAPRPRLPARGVLAGELVLLPPGGSRDHPQVCRTSPTASRRAASPGSPGGWTESAAG